MQECFSELNIFFLLKKKNLDSFFGPNVELGSDPSCLNLTQNVRPQKTVTMYGARKNVSKLNLTQHLSYAHIVHATSCIQPNPTQIWLLLVYSTCKYMAHTDIWRTQVYGARN